jgi:multidrug resistance efflux pump
VSQKTGTESTIQARRPGRRSAAACAITGRAGLAPELTTAEDLRARPAQQAQASLTPPGLADAFVTAPVARVVGSKSASVGTMVAAGSLITIISDGVARGAARG